MSAFADLPWFRIFWAAHSHWAIVRLPESEWMPARTIVRLGRLRVIWRNT